ncbi:MAG: SDR family oxidoreductase [Planctomycetota bacterium]
MPWDPTVPRCLELPTRPQPEMGRVLVTGASGYVGGRLIPELLARGYRLRLMVRGHGEVHHARWPEAEVVEADTLDRESLRRALTGVHAAYYLVHSLQLGRKAFERAEIASAENFRDIAAECGVRRILYLGGLGDTERSRSRHLRSRAAVGRMLRSGSVPVTSLRAAVIMGSGSASYEILRHLVSRVRVIPLPRLAYHVCQPISIRDVIKYLVGALENPDTAGRMFDIGGVDILCYREMLRVFAEVAGRRILLVRTGLPYIRPIAYFVGLITPVPAQITSCLLEGLKDDSVCRNVDIRRYVPFEPVPYREAIRRALTREEMDQVPTRWSDAYPPGHELARRLHEIDERIRFTGTWTSTSAKPAAALFASVCRIGGRTGWFNNNWLWRARGLLDRLLMGPGSARGRRSDTTLAVNDVIDFWRVEDYQPDRRLLLRAEMVLPGQAWLEFEVEDEGERRRLSTTAYFHTSSLLGKVYWYAFLPFHHVIFDDLLAQIEKRS